MLREQGNKVVLCCNGKACPLLSTDEVGNIVIEDDFGGKIKITQEQAKLIPQAIDQATE